MKVVSVIKASPYLSNTFDEPGSGRKQAAAVITYFSMSIGLLQLAYQRFSTQTTGHLKAVTVLSI